MRLKSIAVAAFAFASLVVPTVAQSEEAVMQRIEDLHGMSEEFGEVFAQIQDAFQLDNPGVLADLTFYPLEVEANGELYDIFDPQDLVVNYDALVMPETRAAVANQQFGDLIVTSDGVGFANGALWVSRVCEDESCDIAEWGIIRINN